MALIKQVSPLDIHRESLLDVEEQLRLLVHMMEGAKISCFLPLLKGSFSSWIWTNLGILVNPFFLMYLSEREKDRALL